MHLCLAIGVSRYKPGLRQLPGAIAGARAFGAWASRNDYNTILITDGPPDGDITIERVRVALSEQLETKEIHRLLVYFAGHGLARDAGDEFWLLPDVSRNPAEAIHVTAFRRQLEQWGIPQIGFFADACRTAGKLGFNVYGSMVIENSGGKFRKPQFDRFLATSLGDPALGIQGIINADHRCLFTSVVVDALNGHHPAAIRAEYHPSAPAVVSDSLADFVNGEVQRKASLLGRMQEPEIDAGFTFPNDVYTLLKRIGVPIVPGPDTQPDIDLQRSAKEAEQRDLARQANVASILNEMGPPRSLQHLIPRHLIPQLGVRTGALALPAQDLPVSFPRDAIATSSPIGGARTDGSVISFDLADRRELTTLVRTPNGGWTQVSIFGGLLAFLSFTASAGAALSYTSFDAIAFQDDTQKTVLEDFQAVLAPLLAGTLRSAAVVDVADRTRHGKHQNPVLGVIAAYLYDTIGDYDNIRRMAAYYVDENQPIPFDIALLGAERLHWQPSGPVLADFAEVQEQSGQSQERRRPRYARVATPRLEGVPIAGFIPWMRQGWAVLDVRPELEMPGLIREFGRDIGDSSFTILSEVAGEHLLKLLEHRVSVEAVPA